MNASIFVNWGFIVVNYNVCGTKVKDMGRCKLGPLVSMI